MVGKWTFWSEICLSNNKIYRKISEIQQMIDRISLNMLNSKALSKVFELFQRQLSTWLLALQFSSFVYLKMIRYCPFSESTFPIAECWSRKKRPKMPGFRENKNDLAKFWEKAFLIKSNHSNNKAKLKKH